MIRAYGSAPGDETGMRWAAGYQAYSQAARADRGPAQWDDGYAVLADAIMAAVRQ